MGSFFSLHYRFNLFFRFPLLRVSHHEHRQISQHHQHLYRDMRGSERIVEQGRNISGGSEKDLIQDQRGESVGEEAWGFWRGVVRGSMGT